jgi:ferredoxin
MRGSARLTVNPIACDGRGLCAEVAPELVTLDDWGYPILRPGAIPPELLTRARDAVKLCPKLALRLSQLATAAPRERAPANFGVPCW